MKYWEDTGKFEVCQVLSVSFMDVLKNQSVVQQMGGFSSLVTIITQNNKQPFPSCLPFQQTIKYSDQIEGSVDISGGSPV